MKIWINHPHTKDPSVSLTLMVVSVVLFIGLGILDVLGKIKGIGVFHEFLYATMGLYFGRKFQIPKMQKTGVKTNEKNK